MRLPQQIEICFARTKLKQRPNMKMLGFLLLVNYLDNLSLINLIIGYFLYSIHNLLI